MTGFEGRLKSSPCCANCKHWLAELATAYGNCELNSYYRRKGAQTHMEVPFLTLDLSLCSKWEQKPND